MFGRLLNHLVIIVLVVMLYYYRQWADIPEAKKDVLMMIMDWLPLMVLTVYGSYLTMGLGALIVIIIGASRTNRIAQKAQTETAPKGWAADLETSVSPMSSARRGCSVPRACAPANDANLTRRPITVGVNSKHEE